MHITTIGMEVVNLIAIMIIIFEARKIYGKEITSAFLWGSVLWTGTIENLNVIFGGYDYFAYADFYSFGGKVIEGYGGYAAWILFVPLSVCVGWFVLSFPAFIISLRLFGEKSNIWLKATFGGIILVSWDVLVDPVAVVNEWWRWTMPGLYFHGVPLGNWTGWFFLLFFFGAIFERTVLQRKGFRLLSIIERPLFRMDTLDLSSLHILKVKRVFYFRLIAFLPVFIIANTLIYGVTTELWNNRWGPFHNVFPDGPPHIEYKIPPQGVKQHDHFPPHLKDKYGQ